jgi:hypothetical protein
VLAASVALSACGGSAARALAPAVCVQVRQLTSVPAPTEVLGRPGQTSASLTLFSWPRTLIAGLEQSGNAALAKAGQDLVIAADDDSVASANATIVRAKTICRSLAP